MFLSLGDDGPATAIRFCRFFANVDFDGVEERGKRVEISERHGDFLIGLDPAQRNLQINPEWGLIVTRRGSYTFVKTAETTIRIIIPSIAYGRIQMKIVRLEFALDLRSKFARTASPEGFLSDFMLFREGQIGPVDPINRGRIFQCCRRHEGDIPRRECSGHLQIGRASCRERVCQYVYISVVAGSLKK